MRTVFAVDYDDGTYRKKEGDTVPAALLAKKGPWLVRTGLAKQIAPKRKKAEVED